MLLLAGLLVASALASGLVREGANARELHGPNLVPARFTAPASESPDTPPSTGAVTATITGEARVIDGDTLDINGTRIRLEGIDAPETAQLCSRRWLGQWRCGAEATTFMVGLTRGKPVSCTPQGRDKYGRTLATCYVEGRDINAEMVRQGYAWAFVKYSNRYVREEAEARAVKAGIWQGPATPAWYWRQQQWTAAEPAAPQGCAIKGNASKNGLVYHTPWSPWYGKVHMGGDGKRWFCSESEAIAAGYRAAGAH